MRICHRICAQSCWTCGFLAFSPCAQLIGEWDSSFGVWRMQCRCCHMFLYYVGLLVFTFLSRMFVVFRFHSASGFLVSLTLNTGRSEWLTHILSEILGRISVTSWFSHVMFASHCLVVMFAAVGQQRLAVRVGEQGVAGCPSSTQRACSGSQALPAFCLYRQACPV